MRRDTPHGVAVVLAGDTRAALCDALGFPVEIGRDDRGAPVMPAGWLGSASHKDEHAAGLVAPDDGVGARIGVDLEHARAPRMAIERRVMTAAELARLGSDRREITRTFAIKEAIYKAIDPFVRRYVGFLEVELAFAGEAVAVRTPLPFAIDAWWCELDGFWLATARARRR